MSNLTRIHFLGLLFFVLSSPLAFAFSTHNASHQLNCDIFAEQNGLLIMEVESALPSDEWALQTRVEGSTGTGYYEWKPGDPSQRTESPGGGILTYTFDVANTGTYRFILRSAAPHSTEHNDVWARFTNNEVVGIKSNGNSEIDLGQNSWFKVYQNKGGDSWNWAANTVDHNAHQIFALIETPGIYTLQLSGRSTQFKIDRVVLFHESVSLGVATNLESQESNCQDGSSNLRPPETPGNLTKGLQYAYYEGSWNQIPDFTSLVPVKTGVASNIDLSPRDSDNQFGFLFTGYLNAPTDGLYTFHTSSDDGSQLFIGDQQVVNNDGTHAENEESGLIGLQAGLHPFTVLFFENAGEEVLSVSWTPPGQSKKVISDEDLFYDTDNLLPVELISFDAVTDEDQVVLLWQTASELNNAGFYVERAIDSDKTFDSIGFVEGAGTTTIEQNYSYRDIHVPPYTQSVTYRIKQLDFDGQFSYSPSVRVEWPLANGTQLYSNYPNPFNPSTLLSFSLPQPGEVRVSVYDVSGRHINTLLNEQRSAGFHEITFTANPNLPSGTYIYRLITPNETISGTMLLLK